MQHLDQDRVRARAHQIWEREGRPDGRHVEHWHMACAEIASEDEPKPAAKPASIAKARARKAAKKAEPVRSAEPRKRSTRKTAAAA